MSGLVFMEFGINSKIKSNPIYTFIGYIYTQSYWKMVYSTMANQVWRLNNSKVYWLI